MKFGGHNTGWLMVRPEITGGGSDTTILTDALVCGFGLGLRVADATVAVLPMTVPLGVAQSTFSVKVNCAAAPLVSAGDVQLTCPVPPIGGVVHVQPGATMDWNVVATGSTSVKLRLAASFGPLFVTVIVYETLCPLRIVPELAAMVVTRFAPGSAKGSTRPVYAYLCCR